MQRTEMREPERFSINSRIYRILKPRAIAWRTGLRWGFALALTSPASLAPGAAELSQAPAIDFYSIINITFEKNLEIAAARYDIEASDYQFQRFERNLSQFIPLILDSTAERDSDSFLDEGNRIRENEDEARVTVGFEKEFFDGKKIAAGAGMRGTFNDDGENTNPFIGGEVEFPLFSSFTTLERVTERNFEENELFNAWLDFIDTVRDSISDSHKAYVELETEVSENALARRAVDELQGILDAPYMADRETERREIADQIQAFHSDAVNTEGNVDASVIELLDQLGVESLFRENIRPLKMVNGGSYYGNRYIERDIEKLILDAVESDVEIRVLKIAKKNAELKKSLAERGKWDITGKLFGNYDFQQQGDDRRERSGYTVGVGFDVRRNDPKLLRLSMQQAEAEIRRFTAEIQWRERQVVNLIKRRVRQAHNERALIQELKASKELRRSVYEQKLSSFRSGEETIDNVIRSYVSLIRTEEDLVESLADFYEIVIDLDVASGFYFERLGDVVKEIGESYRVNGFN